MPHPSSSSWAQAGRQSLFASQAVEPPVGNVDSERSPDKRDTGQALVFVALAIPVLLGFLGLAIDMGYLRYVKRQVQMGADAAAIAAASEIPMCTTAGCAALTTAGVTAVSKDNSFPNVSQSTVCSPSPGTGATLVTVNNPPACLASDPNNGNSAYVETIVAENVPTFFAKIFGFNSVTISARAEGGLGGGGNCVYVLDQTGSSALRLVLGAYSANCGVVDESSSSSAFSCFIGSFGAPYIGVVGGDGIPLCSFPGASPTTGISAPSPTDPLAYRQATMKAAAPSPTTCGTTTKSPYTGSPSPLTISSTVTLNSGTYCGGISIQQGANVTFNPGIYTLTSTSTSNGGLTISVGTTVSGSGGVAFYNSNIRNGSAVAGANGGINFVCSSCGAGNVTLTAPTSGPFEGILFFQDPGNTSSSVVVGSSYYNTKLTGTTYLPSASVTFAFDILVDYNDLVAKDVTFGLTLSGQQINTTSYSNYTSLASGSPLKGSIGVLAE
jgi:hypothetical protein